MSGTLDKMINEDLQEQMEVDSTEELQTLEEIVEFILLGLDSPTEKPGSIPGVTPITS